MLHATVPVGCNRTLSLLYLKVATRTNKKTLLKALTGENDACSLVCLFSSGCDEWLREELVEAKETMGLCCDDKKSVNAKSKC